MGCDIHVYTEKRNQDGHWVNVDLWKLNEYYNPYDPDYESEPQWNVKPIYTDRHYALFSALAGVRGSGEPLFSEPRGLPDDVSDIVRAEHDRWDGDGHSHSYATLAELRAWAEKQDIQFISGWTSEADALALDQNGTPPTDWFPIQNRWATVYREWAEPFRVMGALLQSMIDRARDEFWCRADTALTAEQEQKFRIVFWFDN
jgi:hypothetical protein